MEKLYLAIEIGATKQQIAIGTSTGELLEVIQDKFPLPNGAADILAWIERRGAEILSRKDYKSRVVKIAAGFGGPIESRTGRILSSIQVKGWENFKLGEWLTEKFQLPAIVINDTVCGGFSELYRGGGTEAKNLFYTNIGSGIGGVLFINKQYYDGVGFGACYLGNSYIPDWNTKEIGKPQKVENICSGLGIEARLRTPGYVPEDSLIYKKCGGNPQEISCLMLEKAAREGDSFALDEVNRMAYSYSIGISNILALLGPDLIIIGGGVAKMGELLFKPIRTYVDQMCFIANRGNYKIIQSQLLDDAVIVGAVICAAMDQTK